MSSVPPSLLMKYGEEKVVRHKVEIDNVNILTDNYKLSVLIDISH